MQINLKTLSTFLAVAETASFRQTADQIHLSLPAVSMQIKQLEERLGVKLFNRTTRKVSLTREGEQLLIGTRKAMAELDGTLARIQQVADIQQGHLSMACVPTITSTRLPAVLTRFATAFPGITVRVREMAQPELLEAVRRREVDFGIGPTPERAGALECQPLFVDSYVAVVPADHRAAKKASIGLRELTRMRLLSLGTSQFKTHLQQALENEGVALQPAYEFTHVHSVLAMIEAGLGVGLLPRVAIPRDTPLALVRVVRPVMSRQIAVINIRGHAFSPAAQAFVTLCGTLIPPDTLTAA